MNVTPKTVKWAPLPKKYRSCVVRAIKHEKCDRACKTSTKSAPSLQNVYVHVYVPFLDQAFTLSMDATSSVLDVKNQLYKLIPSVPVAQQLIKLDGVELSNSSSIVESANSDLPVVAPGYSAMPSKCLFELHKTRLHDSKAAIKPDAAESHKGDGSKVTNRARPIQRLDTAGSASGSKFTVSKRPVLSYKQVVRQAQRNLDSASTRLIKDTPYHHSAENQANEINLSPDQWLSNSVKDQISNLLSAGITMEEIAEQLKQKAVITAPGDANSCENDAGKEQLGPSEPPSSTASTATPDIGKNAHPSRLVVPSAFPENTLPTNPGASDLVLYVKSKINNTPLELIIDTTAQTTLLSKAAAKLAKITNLIDRRFYYSAKEERSSKTIGRIHVIETMLSDKNGESLPLTFSFEIVDSNKVYGRIGLDKLMRYKTIVDFKQLVLQIGDHQVPLFQKGR